MDMRLRNQPRTNQESSLVPAARNGGGFFLPRRRQLRVVRAGAWMQMQNRMVGGILSLCLGVLVFSLQDPL
ncbi:MAG: hypothetical protein E5Y29_21135, partial [Mesorhizobium sp.]